MFDILSTINCKVAAPELLPERAHVGDAGVDLKAAHSLKIYPGAVAKVDTGFALEVPYGWVALAVSRSGHGKPNIRVSLSNRLGVIDHQYRGNIMLNLENLGEDIFEVKYGERIAQLLVMPCWVGNLNPVDELSSTTRGEAGFGSTGK